MEFLSKYSLLNRNGEPQDDDGMEDPKPVRRFAKRRTYDIKDMILWCILVGSLLANVVLWWSSRHHEGKGGKWGDYGGFGVVERAWPKHSEYADAEDLAATDLAWSRIKIEQGIIALDHKFAESMRIPKSVDYPWDQSKGIFATAGMHSLHCLKAIYQMHYEYREDLNQTYPEEHMLHCFDTIREDIMCHADETPRYIAADGASTGVGQYRKCRDWNAYERWVAEHRSCFNYYQETINVHDPHNPDTLKNFMYCPAGSEYLPAIRKFFNKSDDWIPNPPLEGWLPALGLYKGDPGAPPEGRGW